MNILFTCGGTGGHINPAIAVAKMIKNRHPDASILFAGANDGMETKLVPHEGFELKTVDVSSFQRSIMPKAISHNIKTVLTLNRSKQQAKKIVEDFKPDAVIGTGGYACYPIIFAASQLGIPTAIHESNAFPGLTTRMLSDCVTKIMVSFEDSRSQYKDPGKVIVTGTPVREDFLYIKKSDAKKALGLDDRPLIVSYWGSLGAREMNKKTAEFIRIESQSDCFNHIHATGSFGWRWMPDLVKSLGVDLEKHPCIDMREYIFNMPVVMNAADIIICRSGASTLSEVEAVAVPAIIIPSPNVAENHQEKNARVLENNGGAKVILEKDCSGQQLFDCVTELLADTERRKSMSTALQNMAVLDAAERIYSVIFDTLLN